MRTSGAFEAIDDPADPAWAGYAAVDRSTLRRRLLVAAAIVAAGVIGAGIVAMLQGDDPQPVAAAEPATVASPMVGSSSTIEAPPLPEPSPSSTSKAGSSHRAETTAPAAGGSGWAPAQVTQPSYSPDRLTGDTSGVAAVVTSRLDSLAKELGQPIEVISGWRTRHEQTELYQQYVAGSGNLAAVPGTSLHEVGRAADVYVDGVALASVKGAKELALAYGLHFPVAGEPWHVELVGDPAGSGS